MSSDLLVDCPYRGLMPYSEDDAHFFFGREQDQELLIANLFASRLTVLYGASGVGKSSLLQAGVVHALRQEAARNRRRGSPEIAVAVLRSWTGDPIRTLLNQVEDAVSKSLQGAVPAPASNSSPAQALQHYAHLLDSQATAHSQPESNRGHLVLILDQFEELFVHQPGEPKDGNISLQFARLISDPTLPASFLISIREDALAKLDRFKGHIPELFGNYLRIQHLDRTAATDAIRKPLLKYNQMRKPSQPVEIEDALVQVVLDEVRTGAVRLDDARGGAPGDSDISRIETPFLQLVMARIWQQEQNKQPARLRLETFQQLGGAAQIVKQHVKFHLDGFSQAQRDTAAQMFSHLVAPGGFKIATTARELAERIERPLEQVEQVLEMLARPAARILRKDGETYQLTHDVLGPTVLAYSRSIRRQRLEEQHRKEQKAQSFKHLALGLFITVAALSWATFRARQAQNEAEASRDQLAKNQVELDRKQADLKRKQAELSALVDELQKANERYKSNLELRQLLATNDRKAFIEEADTLRLSTQKIRFQAGKLPKARYYMKPDPGSISGGSEAIALVMYKINDPSFRNSLIVAGPDREFAAVYEGRECVRPDTYAIVEYRDAKRPPDIVKFNMCRAMHPDTVAGNDGPGPGMTTPH